MAAKSKSLRSALGRVRGLGSARSGTHHWMVQRVTALALIPLSLYTLVGFFNSAIGEGYSGAIYWLQSPLAATFTVMLLLTGLRHGAAGIAGGGYQNIQLFFAFL